MTPSHHHGSRKAVASAERDALWYDSGGPDGATHLRVASTDPVAAFSQSHEREVPFGSPADDLALVIVGAREDACVSEPDQGVVRGC